MVIDAGYAALMTAGRFLRPSSIPPQIEGTKPAGPPLVRKQCRSRSTSQAPARSVSGYGARPPRPEAMETSQATEPEPETNPQDAADGSRTVGAAAVMPAPETPGTGAAAARPAPEAHRADEVAARPESAVRMNDESSEDLD
jgi:hypothetical protein